MTQENHAIDDLFDVLSHPHRRRILIALLEEGPERTVGLEELHLRTADARRQTVALHHLHLPKLVELGLVDWDVEAGTVARGPRFDAVVTLLVRLDDRGDDRPPG